MDENNYGSQQPEYIVPPLYIRVFYNIILRFLSLFIVTLVFSVSTRAMVYFLSEKLGVFYTVVLEIIITVLYFVFLYRFAGKGYKRAISLSDYYIATSIIYLTFSAVCIGAYFLLDKAIYIWVFRMSLSIPGILTMKVGDNLIVPILIFHGVCFFILLIEPYIAEKIFERDMRILDE